MKNFNLGKNLVFIMILLTCVSLLFIFWYKHKYVEHNINYEVNSLNLNRKLLIATMSSPFKDSIKTEVLDRYNTSSIIIESIDVKALENIEICDFDAILILHRWEAGAPTESVQSFMNKNLRFKNKIVMLTTSWNGLEKMENIDAITGASIIKDIPIITDKVIKKLDGLLKYED